MSNNSLNTGKCIVKNKDFEVKPYNTDHKPDNIIFKRDGYGRINISYKIAQTNIDAVWNTDDLHVNTIVFQYKDHLLVEIKDPHIQSVAEYLNKFNNISKVELNKLLEDAQNETKSKLEQQIEDLKTEKEDLAEKIAIYRQIQTKKDEIKELLSKLEE